MKHSLNGTCWSVIQRRAAVQYTQVVDDNIWMSPGRASATSCSPRLPARWLRHHWLAPLASATTTARPASARQGTWPGAALTARP